MVSMHIKLSHAQREWLYLLFCSVFSVGMLLVRMVYTDTYEYRFMAVNLFLAWVPYLCAKAVQRSAIKGLPLFALGFLWLIFFPNAPYMLTDIFHLPEFQSMPMWFDLIMLLSFSWCGLLLGFYSLKKILKRFAKGKTSIHPVIVFCIFLISGIGIYLGRYERWNSWEIITQPMVLYTDFIYLLRDKYTVIQMLSLSALYSVFFTMVYVALSLRTHDTAEEA